MPLRKALESIRLNQGYALCNRPPALQGLYQVQVKPPSPEELPTAVTTLRSPPILYKTGKGLVTARQAVC